MSYSAKMLAFHAQVDKAYVEALRACRHPQAEPVILSTGELVACVCIGCYQQLPADYIEGQASKAHSEAYCRHEDGVEVTRFGSRDRTYACTDCGSWVSDGTWPTLNPPPFP